MKKEGNYNKNSIKNMLRNKLYMKNYIKEGEYNSHRGLIRLIEN